jgi:hypothetical protein
MPHLLASRISEAASTAPILLNCLQLDLTIDVFVDDDIDDDGGDGDVDNLLEPTRDIESVFIADVVDDDDDDDDVGIEFSD